MPVSSYLRRGGWALLVLLLFVLAYFAGSILVVGLVDEPVAATVVLNTLIAVLVVAVRWCKPRWLSYSPAPETGKITGNQFSWLLMAFALALVAGQVISQMIYLHQGSTGFDSSVETRRAANPVVLLLLTVIVAPIAEELLLRGTLYPLLRKHLGVIVSALLSSGVFAAIHGNVVQMIVAVPMGLVLALLYERVRSPWPGVALHVIYNVIIIVTPVDLVASLTVPGVAIPLTLACAVALTLLYIRLRPAETVAQD